MASNDSRISVPSAARFRDAAAALSSGGLVVFPTETFYGLGARVTDAGLARAQDAKGREPNKPIALIAATLADVMAFAPLEGPLATLAAAFWPGPLTLLVRPHAPVPSGVAGPDGTVGVRVSPHETAREVARLAGGLVTATSANLAGGQPIVRIDDLDATLRARVDVILDGGTCPGGAPSTLVGFRDGTAVIIRDGAISRAQIAEVLG